MPRPILTESMQNYLKRILVLEETGSGTVSTQAIADALGKTPASVTGMLKKLAQSRLVNYEPYQGVRLTPAGRKIALEVLRHHRLLELYLHQALGYSWDQVHAEAERLEHHISEEFEDRIDAMLGYPATDPHGDPIPRRDGSMPDRRMTLLYALAPGTPGVVARVDDQDPQRLRYLTEIGLLLGTRVEVLRRDPFDGPLHVRVLGEDAPRELVLGKALALSVMVIALSEEAKGRRRPERG
jgi:DtxR family Mn-dependent transcriptional regulator